MKTYLMIPTSFGVGLTSASLGMIRALDSLGLKTGFLKPFAQEHHAALSTGTPPVAKADHTAQLLSQILHETVPPSIEQARTEHMLGTGAIDELLEDVVALYQTAGQGKDALIVEGMLASSESSYAIQLNVALAQALNAEVILVATADMAHPEATADMLDIYARPFGGVEADRTVGAILMRVKGLPEPEFLAGHAPLPQPLLATELTNFTRQLQQSSPHIGTDTFKILGMVPFSRHLSVPRVQDIATALNATWLNEGDKKRRVQSTSLCARTVPNVLAEFKVGSLIVTPGDREDILIAAALASMNGVPLAGVLLTGGFMPSPLLVDFCRPALRLGLPVLSVPDDSFTTVSRLAHIDREIPIDDIERAEQVTAFVAAYLDRSWLKTKSSSQTVNRVSPSAFRYALVQKAQASPQRIVLPEGAEPRTVQAAAICQTRGIAHCILLAKPDDVQAVAAGLSLTLPEGLQIIDPDSIRQRYIQPMVERRSGKLTADLAEAALADTVVLGTMMLYLGEVDGLVSGAVHTTANTVRPAFQLIKTAPQFSLVSSIFFMLLPEQVIVYGDCAINPDPNAAELAEIAIQSADSAAAFGLTPKVAMISYSTGDSGTGMDVDKVREATQIVRDRRPDIVIDGPLQYDAAAIESVGRQKAPNSPVAGQATVFVFPDLNTGNTTYKAVQRSAGVVSVGPMLQGLNKPVNDLSRGALVEDIVYTIALTAIQAQQALQHANLQHAKTN